MARYWCSGINLQGSLVRPYVAARLWPGIGAQGSTYRAHWYVPRWQVDYGQVLVLWDQSTGLTGTSQMAGRLCKGIGAQGSTYRTHWYVPRWRVDYGKGIGAQGSTYRAHWYVPRWQVDYGQVLVLWDQSTGLTGTSLDGG